MVVDVQTSNGACANKCHMVHKRSQPVAPNMLRLFARAFSSRTHEPLLLHGCSELDKIIHGYFDVDCTRYIDLTGPT